MNLALKRVARFLADEPDRQSIVIWGNGQLGVSIRRLIKHTFGEGKVVYTLDSSVQSPTQTSEGMVYPLSALQTFDLDCLVVASIEYEADILATIERDYPEYVERVYAFSRDPQLAEVKAKDLSGLSIESLNELVFMFPDCAELWHALSEKSQGETAEAYAICAHALGKASF